MKKSNLIKLFSILLIGVMVLTFSTTVFAADDDEGFTTLPLNGNNTNINANNTNTNNTNNTNTNNANTNRNNSNTNSNNTNATNIYNTNNLPQTGIEDSIPVAMLVVIFSISAIYAYKKIKDYRNI